MPEEAHQVATDAKAFGRRQGERLPCPVVEDNSCLVAQCGVIRLSQLT